MAVDNVLDILRCPDTGQPLLPTHDGLGSADGSRSYPVIGGIPVLLTGDGLFDAKSYVAPDTTRNRSLREVLTRAPSLTLSTSSDANLMRFAGLVRDAVDRGLPARVLIVGGASLGEGCEALLTLPGIDVVETDVELTERLDLVCDVHQLPFADGTFAAVVCQAVLEHVLDPVQAVAEIHRVLASGGLVYSEVPFMQQVHAGAFDFTRYTLVGHRRLFRFFDEIDSGVEGGPATALGWSMRYFAMALGGRSRLARAALARVVFFGFFWLKYLDRILLSSPVSRDAPAGTFFLGQRRQHPLSDREIVAGYRGAQASIRFGS